jgi:hypothetical protein
MRHRNDLMLRQIRRLVDDRMSRKIRGRRRDHTTNFAEADRNETRIRKVGNPQRDVDAFVDQIHLTIDEKQPDRHRRIFVHEGIDHRPYQVFPGDDGRGQRQDPAGRRAFAAGRNIRFLEVDQHAPAGDYVALARLAQFQGACSPMQQLGPDVRFEKGYCPTHRRRRSPQPPARTGQAAFVHGRHKDFHRIDTVHGSFRCAPRSTDRLKVHPLRGKSR